MKKRQRADILPEEAGSKPEYDIASRSENMEKLLSELEVVNSSFRSSLKLRGYLENPRIPFSEKQKTLKEIFKDYISPQTYDFVFILLRCNALSSLNEILRSYQRAQIESGVMEIEVRTAVPLNNEEKERLSKSFSQKLKKPVHIKNIIDPDVIGGMVIKSGDMMIDASLKSRIEDLLKNIKQG
ncbi:MAG: ATP synthase F1 subunit delta [candidate division WOR-3 bacterium]|nr:ATP synthase F1 subunit delta [candidate division WOR-3 bacterium]